jgi:hypothetical protein
LLLIVYFVDGVVAVVSCYVAVVVLFVSMPLGPNKIRVEGAENKMKMGLQSKSQV